MQKGADTFTQAFYRMQKGASNHTERLARQA
jgi:hypothetical protein